MNENSEKPPAKKRRFGQSGQSIVEFGMVSIVFFFLVFGIIDFARMFQSWVTVQHAAREGARYAVTGQISCVGTPDDRDACIVEKAKAATAGLTGGGLGGTAVTVTYTSWQYPSYADPGLAGDSGAACDAIEVDVEYTHTFALPVLQVIAPSGVELHGRQRMVNEPFGPCN
jgi:Flp pilus assembly protein TadG